MHERHPLALTRITFLAIALVIMLTALTMPADAVWVTDSGNRRIQAESLLATGFASRAILWPGRPIDPDLRHFPNAGHHFLIRSGTAISFYSPIYPALTAWPLRVLGGRGVILLSAFAAILILALTAALARRLGSSDAGSALAVAVAGLATPLWFYSAVYWEHALAVALSTAAMLLLIGPQGADSRSAIRASAGPLLAGIAVAGSTWLREEGYVVALALAAARVLADRRIGPAVAFSASFAAGMLPLWVLNVTWSGSPLGIHTVVYGAIGSEAGPRELAFRVGEYLARSHPSAILSLLLALPAIGLAAAAVMPAAARLLLVPALALAGASAAVMALWQYGSPDPVRATLWTQGLLPAMPWAVAALALRDRAPASRVLAWATAIGLVVTPLLLHRSDIGVIWGPRHFLWIAPPAAAMVGAGFERLRRQRFGWAAMAILFAGTALLQLEGIRVLRLKTEHGARTMAALASAPGPIVTDVFWLPEELAAIWMERPIFYVESDSELQQLRESMRTAGVRRWNLILSRTERRLSQDPLAEIVAAAERRTRVASDAESLDLMIVEIGDGPASRGQGP